MEGGNECPVTSDTSLPEVAARTTLGAPPERSAHPLATITLPHRAPAAQLPDGKS